MRVEINGLAIGAVGLLVYAPFANRPWEIVALAVILLAFTVRIRKVKP